MPTPTPPDRSISKAQEAALTYKNTPKLRAGRGHRGVSPRRHRRQHLPRGAAQPA